MGLFTKKLIELATPLFQFWVTKFEKFEKF